MKTNAPILLAFLATCSLFRDASAKEEDYVGMKLVGIHDSNRRDVLSPGFFVYFEPIYIEAEFGPDVWQVQLREDLDTKDFNIDFRVHANKENIGGSLEASIPVKKKYAVRSLGGFGGDAKNKLYFTAALGVDYEHAATRQKFSVDVIQEFGRKNGTMLLLRSSQRINDWNIEEGAQLTRFWECGMFFKVRYKRVFVEAAHYGDYDYYGFDRTRAGIGMQFDF